MSTPENGMIKIQNQKMEIERKYHQALKKAIEHNLDIVKNADHVIDLGPEGGRGGGTIIAEGTPEEIQNNAEVRRVYLGQG